MHKNNKFQKFPISPRNPRSRKTTNSKIKASRYSYTPKDSKRSHRIQLYMTKPALTSQSKQPSHTTQSQPRIQIKQTETTQIQQNQCSDTNSKLRWCKRNGDGIQLGVRNHYYQLEKHKRREVRREHRKSPLKSSREIGAHLEVAETAKLRNPSS